MNNSKRTIRKVIILFLSILLLSNTVLAHPGKTDRNGGHTDHSTGEYHYHHGYSAHQHTDGVCPYDFDDKTNHSSNDTPSIESGREPDYIVDINGNVTKVRRNKKTDDNSSTSYAVEDDTSQISSNTKESHLKDILSTLLEFSYAFVVLYLCLFALVYIPEFFRKVLDFIKKKK